MGALNARAVIDERERNTAMSVYVTGGTLGVASGPLVGALILWAMGLHGTIFMLIPGVLICIFMLRQGREIAARVPRRVRGRPQSAPDPPGHDERDHRHDDAAGVDDLRRADLLADLVQGTRLRQVDAERAGNDPATQHRAWHGWSGALADRLAGACPDLASKHPHGAPLRPIPGTMGFPDRRPDGFPGRVDLPLLLVIAQELMSGRAGLASGLIMGLGFAMSAIGIPITGWIGDQHGLQDAMRFQAAIGARPSCSPGSCPPSRRSAYCAAIRSRYLARATNRARRFRHSWSNAPSAVCTCQFAWAALGSDQARLVLR